MKLNGLFISLIIILNSCVSLEKVDITTIDKKTKGKIDAVAFNIFAGCETNKFPKLNESNATKGLLKIYTNENLIKNCDVIKVNFGKINSIGFVEVLKNDKNNYVFRYQAKFNKAQNFFEIRVYTTLDFKFNGIIYKDKWVDKYTR